MAEEYVSGEEYQAMSRNKSPKKGREVAVSTKLIGAIIVVIVLCVLSFFIGDSYGKDHAKTVATTRSASFGSGGPGGGGGYGGFHNGGGFGQVTAVSSSSITVQNPRSGTTTSYSITGSTTITDNEQTIAASAIQVGNTVIVRVASSGSTTATSIMVVAAPSTSSGGSGTVIQ